MKLPAPRINRTNSTILQDKNGKDFVLNKKNYYKHKDIFFKDLSFNRWDNVWSIDRQRTVFLLEVEGSAKTIVLYDLRQNLIHAEEDLNNTIFVKESEETITYCKDLISKGFCYVIIDGQNRETGNRNWYEGELYFIEYDGYVKHGEEDIKVKVPKKIYPTKKGHRNYTYLHSDFKSHKIINGKKSYPYMIPLTDNDFLKAIDECVIPVDMVTKCYRTQMSDVYDSYNLSDNNTPVEIRNSISGELSIYKRSLFHNDKLIETRFPKTDGEKMLTYKKYFDLNGVEPVDSYYTFTSMSENRYSGYLLFEDEITFLNDDDLSKTSDKTYRELYGKYKHNLPMFFSTHQLLVLERAKLYKSFNPKEIKLHIQKSMALDILIFLNDLLNPNEMFKDMNTDSTFVLSDEQLELMDGEEINNFKLKPIKIEDYEKFGKWLFQDVILNEIDDYKIQNGIKTYDTSTNYATHLRTNENWKTRRAMFRENFLLSLTRLVEDGVIKILDNKRVISDKDFRDVLRMSNNKDSRGNKIKDMRKLFSEYAKSHESPWSWGVGKDGITIKKLTGIYTKKENQKVGAGVHV